MPARLQKKQIRLFSFSGIDGAGKSTQIESLRARMEQLGLRVRVYQFWDDVAAFTRFRESGARALFKGDSGIGTPSAPINRRDKNVQSWPMTLMRLCIYLADAISASIFARRALRAGEDALIFDRYIYDELANLKLQNPLLRTYARLVAALVPKPDIALILDAEPSEARARKPEYPLDFLHTCRQSYLRLSHLLGGMTVIPPVSIEEAKVMIFELATTTLPHNVDWQKVTKAPPADSSDVKPITL